ncbi:MAG: hypothetical protein ACRCVV_12860 [Shewanella sp.]
MLLMKFIKYFWLILICWFPTSVLAISLSLSTNSTSTGSVNISFADSNIGSCGYVAYEYKLTNATTWTQGGVIRNNQNVSFSENGQYNVRLRNRLCITYPVNVQQDSYSNVQNLSVLIPPPGVAPSVPTNVKAIQQTSGINITWTRPNSPDGLTGYYISQFQTPNWVTVATIDSTKTSYLLNTSSLVTLRIKAHNSYGSSEWVETWPIGYPPAPSSINVPSNDIDGTYNISWSAVSGAIRYAIYEKKNNEDWVLLSNDL